MLRYRDNGQGVLGTHTPYQGEAKSQEGYNIYSSHSIKINKLQKQIPFAQEWYLNSISSNPQEKHDYHAKPTPKEWRA
jgi:hypothetical protein